jgi:hypothetical protein
MAKVIIHKTENGDVALTIPTPEALAIYGIDWIKNKDTPPSSIIIDDSKLPQGAGASFFSAWEMDNSGNLTVNFSKAQTQKLEEFNSFAIQATQKRQTNSLAGIVNVPDDNAFINELNAARDAIALATTIEQLILINNPS